MYLLSKRVLRAPGKGQSIFVTYASLQSSNAARNHLTSTLASLEKFICCDLLKQEKVMEPVDFAIHVCYLATSLSSSHVHL